MAEPLVADDDTATEFLARISDPDIARVFVGLVDTLKRAGELGLLLRVEDLLNRGPKKSQTGDLFDPPEARIRETLALFVSEGESGQYKTPALCRRRGTRRWFT